MNTSGITPSPHPPHQPTLPHFLTLPTEILQSIYLHCLSPSLPFVSPILSCALSTELIYKLTFLHAFWNTKPLIFAGAQFQQPYEPGPHARALFQPSAVPRAENDDTQARTKLQEIVLGYRWCTFHRAKLYFSSILEAMTRDLFSTLNIPLSSHDQTRLQAFISQLPSSRSTFEATALDGSHITLQYPRRLATALQMTYHGPSPHFDQSTRPNLTIRPTEVLAIPSHLLTGQTEWTEEKIDFLCMLCSHINLRTVQYSLPAFHDGMKNAIVQRNYEALLVLIWQASRLAESKPTTSHDDSPFEPPESLFRLVAKRYMQNLALPDRHSSDTTTNNPSTSIQLFTLLIRAHAESMPQNDPDITAWAHHLLTYQDSSERDRAFGQWVLEWGSEGRSSEYVNDRHTLRRWPYKKVRRPLFRRGGVSRKREGEEMAMRFVEICGGNVEGFGDEVEAVGGARGR